MLRKLTYRYKKDMKNYADYKQICRKWTKKTENCTKNAKEWDAEYKWEISFSKGKYGMHVTVGGS